MNYRTLPGYSVPEGTEYSVTVHPGRGSTYDIYPQCGSCGHPTYHECDAIGPADRIHVPTKKDSSTWAVNAARVLGIEP